MFSLFYKTLLSRGHANIANPMFLISDIYSIGYVAANFKKSLQIKIKHYVYGRIL